MRTAFILSLAGALLIGTGATAQTLTAEAAAKGSPADQWSYAMTLLKADPAEAHRWVRRAAEAGDRNAQNSMGVMLATGEGVAENDAEARTWYLKAAERGLASSLRSLGMMLATGEGGPTDLVRGAAYLEIAAEADDVYAQRMAGQAARLAGKPDEIARIKTEWRASHPAPSPSSQ